MENTIVLNNFPKKLYLFYYLLHKHAKGFHIIFVVAMVTKFKNLIQLYDFIAMETPTVLNNFPKTNISVTTFLMSVKKYFYTVLPVAMVTQFNNIN